MIKRTSTLIMKPTLLTLALAGLFTVQVHAATTTNTFSGLGFLSGGSNSQAYRVSSDGSVVVGKSNTSSGNYESFRWTQAGGMVGLGFLPGGNASWAVGVSSDGSVVVGGSVNSSSNTEAYRWTQAGGMVGLGFLPGGNSSIADGVSSDGSVVVGASLDSAGNNEAYRWTQAGGMVGLGFLSGGNVSNAYSASSNGSVVVGDANTSSGNSEAFRWTQAGGMAGLGFLSGGNASYALGVSSDGSVVVGRSNTSSSNEEAYRWTQAGGMVGLGFLSGGNASWAIRVSSDGSVVVGGAKTGSGSTEAFRWTQAGGMQSVADWLASAKVTLPSGWTLFDAMGTNSDGSVVVGEGTNPSGQTEAWLARVSPIGSGLINPAVFNQSVADTGGAVSMAGLNLPELALEGAHYRTLMGSGITCSAGNGVGVWSTADAAHFNRSDSNMQLAEVGICKDVGTARIGVGVGQAWDQQGLALGGRASYQGQYALAEVDKLFTPRVEGSVLGYYGRFGTTVDRNYQNGGGVSTSVGHTHATSTAVRLRLDLLKFARVGTFELSPYAAYTWMQADVGAYSESGGGFPVAYDGNLSTNNTVRLGTETKAALNDSTELVLNAETVHSMERNTSGVSGQIIGLGGFDVPGTSVRQNWVRVMADVDHHLTQTSLILFGLNAGTEGGDPSYGGTISYHLAL